MVKIFSLFNIAIKIILERVKDRVIQNYIELKKKYNKRIHGGKRHNVSKSILLYTRSALIWS